MAEAAAVVAEMGLRRIEFWSGHLALEDELPRWREALAMCGDLGLSVRSNDPAPVENDVKAARRLFERARELSLEVLNVTATPDALPLLEGLALEYGLRVGVCNTGPETDWSDLGTFEAALRNRDRQLGLCADLGVFLRVPEMPDRVIGQFRDRLYCVYLRDFEADEEGDIGEEMPLGEGTLDVDLTLRCLEEAGYAGPAIVRYEGRLIEPREAVRRTCNRLGLKIRQ